MSSVRDSSPEPDGPPAEEPRRRRGRFGLSRRHHEVPPTPEVTPTPEPIGSGGLDPDLFEALARPSSPRDDAATHEADSQLVTDKARLAEEAAEERTAAEERRAERARLANEADSARERAESSARAAQAEYQRAEAEKAALLDADSAQREEAAQHAAEQAALSRAADAELEAARTRVAELTAAADEAAAARDAAEDRARQAITEYQEAAQEQQAQLTALQESLHRIEEEAARQAQARVEAERAATAHAHARAAAEQLATEQAAARADAEARAAELVQEAAEARAAAERAIAALPDESHPTPAPSPKDPVSAAVPDPLSDPLDTLLPPPGPGSGESDATDKVDDIDGAGEVDESAADDEVEEATGADEVGEMVTPVPAPAIPEGRTFLTAGDILDLALADESREESTDQEQPEAESAEAHRATEDPGGHEAPEETANPDAGEDPMPVPDAEPDSAPEQSPAPAPPGEAKGRSYHAKRGSDSLAPLALLGALACAAVLGRQAYFGDITDDLGLSIGLTVTAIALLIFAVRMTNSSTIVHLDDRGRLKVTAGDNRHVFDLANTDIQLEQDGEPGTRGWKILVLRRTMSPVAIDATMVDPRSFIEAVRQWRPEL